MADVTALDALQAFHQELVAVLERRADAAETLENALLVEALEKELENLWSPRPKSEQSKNSVKSGKIILDHTEYSVNDDFQQAALALSDQVDIDEIEAARYLLDSSSDVATLGRSLLECSIIRFHQQRKYALDALRLLLELDSVGDDVEYDGTPLEAVQIYVAERVFKAAPGARGGATRLIPRCMSAMQALKAKLQKLGDKITAAQTLGQPALSSLSEEAETIEFSRISLLQQHELLATVLCRGVEKRQADTTDLDAFITMLQKVDRYDSLLVHVIPVVGAYISAFGSTEGGYDLKQVRDLNNKFFSVTDEQNWALPFLQAAVRAWWLAEYSGFYLDDPPESAIPPNTDLDEEDRQRSKQFLDSLQGGAFDFLLSIAGDVKPPDWHDPVRAGMHRWLQRKSPNLPADSIPYSDFFQMSLVSQLEVFVDAFISNLPDVLRKLRIEEDEQRQLSQTHEQDLDLERFLLIITYAYEGRPEAALNFWSDPDSNLNGFLHWASRRASTPLVTAFCEMLQAISTSDDCATRAHEFLLDESHHSSGKMRRSHSLTWTQIFKELGFFLDKAKQKPTQSQSVRYRGGKPANDFVETEPESVMMLECYMRLMTKLATESETTRLFLLQNATFGVVEAILELASTPIPPRLRGCCFMALKALMSRKNLQEGHAMWNCVDQWLTGGFAAGHGAHHRQPQQSPVAMMDRTLDEISHGFEDPQCFVQLLLGLVSPGVDSSSLNDGLPFPETLGSAFRAPGVEVYVDYVIGLVFASKANELQDIHQARTLKLGCLDFMLTCLATFNEDLIILANETNLMIDNIISTTDLATYVRMHPFARVMEWMFNDKVIASLFNTIHQDPADVGNAAPDSPLILGILRAVEVISKVMDLQATYLDLVRPILKSQSNHRRPAVSHSAFASFEDGLVTRLNLVVDLGNYCGLGHPQLTLACLKLLERMASSSKIAAVWSGSSRNRHRNKAIVAMEANGEHEAISRSLISELTAPLDAGRESESPSYITKIYILDFLFKCIEETPNRPTIAHVLLGFKCGADTVSIEPNSAFESRTSLFHGLLRVVLETPSGDAQGIRQWLIALKTRAMRILQILWRSPLSASTVMPDLRENEFLFHLLIRESVIQPDLAWEGQSIEDVALPVTDGAIALLDFLDLRSITLEYIAMELCLISQGRMPSVKRRIFEALNGQIIGEGNERIPAPTVFDLYDFLLPETAWEVSLPPLQYHQELDLSACLETDTDANSIYNMDRVQEILLLKRNESQAQGAVIPVSDASNMDREESMILEYLVSTNRQRQIQTRGLRVLKNWVKLLLVMVECNDFKGSSQTSFFLQALQAMLPSLSEFASERPDEASELAKLAKVLLFKLHLANTDAADKNSLAIGNLISDKLYQIFQICLQAIGKWAGSTELRSQYYEICYRYLTGMADDGPLSQTRSKTITAIRVFGERLINVICDDAYGGEPSCQTAALILLGTLVNMDQKEGDTHVVEALNRLNFIGILVDSLRNILQEWQDVFSSGNKDQQNFQNARLALLLQLAQTRLGAKYIFHANLFRAIETSGLFDADPELQVRTDNSRALEQHYDLLAKVVRVMGAAIVNRGSHNVVQGRRFLLDHRMLVTHTLKRSAGIGTGVEDSALEERVEDLADALVVIIAATGFLEYENEAVQEHKQQNGGLFH